jgi:hypothetical protein
MFKYALAYLRSVLRDDRAQDAFEYLLVIGGVSVAIIIAMVTPVGSNIINAVVDGVCTAIQGIPNFGDEVTCP